MDISLRTLSGCTAIGFEGVYDERLVLGVMAASTSAGSIAKQSRIVGYAQARLGQADDGLIGYPCGRAGPRHRMVRQGNHEYRLLRRGHQHIGGLAGSLCGGLGCCGLPQRRYPLDGIMRETAPDGFPTGLLYCQVWQNQALHGERNNVHAVSLHLTDEFASLPFPTGTFCNLFRNH